MPSKNQSILKEQSHDGRRNSLAEGRFYRLQEYVLMYNAPLYIKCHRNKLLGEGRTLYVATRQKESKLSDIASTDFQDKLFLT